MNSVTRRSLLKTVLLGSAHAAFGWIAKTPQLSFPADPRSRIAVATYSFRSMFIAPEDSNGSVNTAGMDLATFARFIRSEFNVSGIEPLHSHFPSTERAAILKLRAAFDAAGVRTVNIPLDEQADLCSPDPAVRKSGYALYQKWVEIAVMLSTPSIRISVPACKGVADIQVAANALKPVIEYAASRNVVVNLENDEPVFANEARVISILNTVSSPYLRALPDFANSLMGGDEAFNARAVKNMFRWATNIAHVKDAEVIRGVRRTVSLQQLFSIAKQANYKGYYSMESDADADPIGDTKHLIEQSLALM